MSKDNGVRIRFGLLVRVSTEKQEKVGESLRTQRTQNERDVERLGGTVVGLYGGQEHATPGWEKKEVDRLLADAARGKFDAVIVAYADRWSRDNVKSEEGLDVFTKHGIRFFVGTMEMNLFDPQHRFILAMNAVVGRFVALQGQKKSIENRIERAKRGVPAAGEIPFGRTYDKATETWGVDPEKRSLVEELARRYLAGESLPTLAKEKGVAYAYMTKVLRERCGDMWEQEFRSDQLNLREVVPTPVPRLLPEETIRLVRHRLEARRTYQHGTPKHSYLLSGYVFCEGCGYNLIGQPGQGGDSKLYYRHAHTDGAKKCPIRPRPWVRANKIEEQVLQQLFNMFGNPTAIAKAIKAAIPDCDEALTQQAKLQAEMDKLKNARARILGLVVKEVLTLEQAESELGDLKGREGILQGQMDKLAMRLADVPSEEAVRLYVDRIEGTHPSVRVVDDDGNTYAGGNDVQSYLMMTDEDRRNLVRAVFNTPLADGTPAGVYVYKTCEGKPHRPQKYGFKLRGRLEFELVMQFAQQLPKELHYKLNGDGKGPRPAPPFELDGQV